VIVKVPRVLNHPGMLGRTPRSAHTNICANGDTDCSRRCLQRRRLPSADTARRFNTRRRISHAIEICVLPTLARSAAVQNTSKATVGMPGRRSFSDCHAEALRCSEGYFRIFFGYVKTDEAGDHVTLDGYEVSTCDEGNALGQVAVGRGHHQAGAVGAAGRPGGRGERAGRADRAGEAVAARSSELRWRLGWWGRHGSA
jgi:hypothetical protein